MNAMLNIQVNVAGRQASAQLRQIQRQVAGLGVTAGQAGVGGANSFRQMAQGISFLKLEKFAKNLQWTGRQLEFSFTLPLVLAGAAATKWANENTKAVTQVRKVYGDLSMSSKQVNAEVDALAISFKLLSDRFGVAQKDVIEIGAAWAQAGSSGVAVAKQTRASLEAMIIGELDATKAVEGLIAVQAGYQLSTDQLADSLADLNVIENQTAISFAGLITVFQKASGTARTAGVTMEELGAMAAALVPAAGSASEAGNALKTMISQLMAPTMQAKDALESIGIVVDSPEWMGLTATGKIELLAEKFQGLTRPTQNIVATALAGRRQVSRLNILFRDVANNAGFYSRALEATSDQQRSTAQYAKELTIFLSSQPQAFQILTTQLKNAMTEAIIPLLPVILALIGRLTKLVRAFTDLSPSMQQFVLIGLLILAVLGPMIRIFGALMLVVSQLGRAFGFMTALMLGHSFTAEQAAAKNIELAAAAMETAAAERILGAATLYSTLQSEGHSVAMTEEALAAAGLSTAEVGAARAIATGDVKMGRQIGVLSLLRSAFIDLGKGIWWLITKPYDLAINSLKGLGGLMTRVWGAILVGAQAAATAMVAIWNVAVTLMQMAWAGLVPFLSRVWVTMLIAWDAVLAAMVAAANWAGSAAGMALVTGFLEKVWVTLLIGFDVIVAALVAIAGALGLPLWALVAIIAAVVAFIIALFNDDFRNGVLNAIGWVIDGLAQLPGVVADIFRAVVDVVRTAMMAVIDWLSYLNPFARHSPSLVDNVTAGVTEILNQYKRLGGVKGILRSAVSSYNQFLEATGPAAAAMQMHDYQEQRKDVVAVSPSAGGAVDSLIRNVLKLKGLLPGLQAQITRQEQVVARWQRRVDQLSGATDRLARLQDTQITGMGASADAIFRNEMAQKRLRLEMLRLEDAGQTADDVRNRFAALQGEIEAMTGKREELRLAGAGSDILGFYDAQLASLMAQQNSLQGQSSEISEIQKQYEELQRQGEILDLERSINFDPQLRQLDELFNRTREMSFAEIQAQGRIQMARVRQLEAAQSQLDKETQKAQDLRDVYSEITDQINEMESALSQFAQAASASIEAAKAASGGGGGAGASAIQEDIAAAGQANFPLPGGTGTLGREGGLLDIEEFNRQMEEELASLGDTFGSFDIFQPIKDMWNSLWGWLKKGFAAVASADFWQAVLGGIVAACAWVWDEAIWPLIQAIGKLGSAIWAVLGPVFRAIGSVIMTLWNTVLRPVFTWLGMVISTYVMPVLRALGAAFMWLWNTILVPFFGWFVEEVLGRFLPIWEAISTVINIVVTLIARLLQGLWRHVIMPVFHFIQDGLEHTNEAFTLLGNVIGVFAQIAGGIIRFFYNLIFKPIFDSVKTKLAVVGGAFLWLWEHAVRPVFNFLAEKASWVWDKLKPIFEKIREWMKDTLPDVFRGFKEAVRTIFNAISDIISSIWSGIADGLEGIVNGFIMAINAVLRGVRAIANFLHIDNDITTIDHVRLPRFHSGGVVGDEGRVSGLAQNERMAVLLKGEGVLSNDVMKRLGQSGYDALLAAGAFQSRNKGSAEKGETGGFFSPLGSLVDTVVDGVQNVGSFISEQALKAIWLPLKQVARGLANQVPHEFFKNIANALIDRIDEFVNGAGDELTKRGIGTLPFGSPLGEPGVDSGIWRAMLSTVQRQFPDVGFFGGYANRNTATGNISRHAYGRAIDISPRWDIFNWLSREFGPRSHEIIFSPAGYQQWYHGSHHIYGEPTRGDHWNHIHWSLANGGIVRGGAGGVLAHIGEGNRNELVTPLPSGFDLNNMGNREIHFHGDLSFPNITDPSDAKEFLENLESLAS